MKYRRLTKEQFEELHQEFINFLATQSITADEWKTIKEEKPELAEQELDIFSDLVWEGVLNQVNYVEHYSTSQMFLFALEASQMKLISIKCTEKDLSKDDDIKWVLGNLGHENVEIFQASKGYSDDSNQDKFKLIEQGAIITKGELYKRLAELITK